MDGEPIRKADIHRLRAGFLQILPAFEKVANEPTYLSNPAKQYHSFRWRQMFSSVSLPLFAALKKKQFPLENV